MNYNVGKYPFVKVFTHTGETFSALNAARAWCAERGYAIGALCYNEPCGLAKGVSRIEKWKNLSNEERDAFEGLMVSDNFRDGNVSLVFKTEVE